jgi:opacity protein-like surface antigen
VSNKNRIIVAAAIVVAGAGKLTAQRMDAMPTDRMVRFGFGGGVVVPREGATVLSVKTGVQGQGFMLIQLPGGLPALRMNVDYAKMKFDRPTTAGAATTVSGDRKVLDGVAGIRLDLLPGPVRPYVLAGVGAFKMEDVVGATSFSDTNFGADGGVGVSFKLGRISGFFETRLQNVWTNKAGFVDTKMIQSFPVSFGLLF